MLEISLQRSAGRRPGSPRPLEIEATEMAGHVDDFADEKQAGHFSALHGLGGKFVGINAADCDFGFFVAFRAGRRNRPRMRLLLESSESGIRPCGGCVQFEPAIGQTVRQNLSELRAQCRREFAESSASRKIAVSSLSGAKINPNLLRLFPVGGNLQDRGAAQSAMGDQHFFAEAAARRRMRRHRRKRRPDRSNENDLPLRTVAARVRARAREF